MSNRLSQEKANAIAAEYMSNGYCKTKALLSVGYKNSYANCKRGLNLYDNVMVKQAIERLQQAGKLKTDITIETIRQDLQQLYDKAIAKGDLATAARCLELIGKTIAAFTDNVKQTGEGLSVTFVQPEPKPAMDAEANIPLKLTETA